MMNADWRQRYEKAIEITRRAGQVALRYFDTDLQVEMKGDASPVTIADRETEQVLRAGLSEAFPTDGFLGEEYGDTPGSSGYRWIIDPIDGTRSFVRGIPTWGTLLGLEYKGELIAGIAESPPFGQTYHALRGQGAFRNDRKIHVSTVDDLSQSMVFYSSLSWFLKAGKETEFTDLVRRSDRQRGYGDWYGFLLVAQGSGEVMVEHGVHAWDIAAIQPIVEEAGGRMTSWNGTFDLFAPDVIASNGKLHEEVLSILHGGRR
ncbi:MAG: inositol monophosphatase family protein [Gemmataceae bacterium]